MTITRTAGAKELAEAARLSVWRALNEFEAGGFTALQTAYYMGMLSAAALDVCEAAEAEAAEPLAAPDPRAGSATRVDGRRLP